MKNAANRFVERAPRYKLRPFDNKVMRFAHSNDRSRSFTTQFVDISTSGIAFITNIEFSPNIGEQIKLEVPLNGNDTIAWFGKVVRVEQYSSTKWWLSEDFFNNEDMVLVAVVFQDLPTGHKQNIRKLLRKKFLEIQSEKRIRTFKNFSLYASQNILRLAFYLVCFLATIWILWTLSQPSLNYDAEKGSPWMQRFPKLNFFDNNYESK